MSIWIHQYTVDDLNKQCKNTLMENLGIEFLEIGDDYIKAQMPVDSRTVQPSVFFMAVPLSPLPRRSEASHPCCVLTINGSNVSAWK